MIRLEALLREFDTAPSPPQHGSSDSSEAIDSPAELAAAELALARAATTSLDLFVPAAAATGEWGPFAPPRCGRNAQVRLARAPNRVVAGLVDGDIRVSELVTARLLIRDRTEAVLATTSEEGAPAAALRTTDPAVVAYLTRVFDSVWNHALPASQCPAEVGPILSADEHELLDELLLGRTDENIARALGVSVRTVQRRAAMLQRRLGVSGRFQLGLRVGLGEIPHRQPSTY